MRVDYNIWSHSSLSKGHVDLRPQNRENTFLAMSRTKLIANYWVSAVTNSVSNAHVTRVSFIPHQTYVLYSRRFIIFKGLYLWLLEHSVVDALICLPVF